MKRMIGFVVVFLFLSPAVFAAVIEDWSNVIPGTNAGTFADNLGSKVEFSTEAGPDGTKAVKLTSTLVKGGWCGVWRSISADLSQNKFLKFKVKTSAPGQVQVALQDTYNVQYTASCPVSSKNWTEVTIPLSSFIKNPYYTPPNAVPGNPMDLSRTTSMNLSSFITGESVVEIGPIESAGTASASPAGTRETQPNRKTPANYQTDNWLFDPGFETPGSYAWLMARVAAEGHESLHSLYAENAPPSWNLACQDVSFQGTHPAHVVYSGWVKTEGVVPGVNPQEAARLGLYFRDDQDRRLGGWQDPVCKVTGTTGWTYYEKRYDVPPGTESAHVAAGLGNGSGKAWFDDLSLALLDQDGKKMEVSRVDRQASDTSDWYAFQPPPAATDAPLDLSFLNDAPAGKHGFVTVKDGRFAFADGTAARFWGAVVVGADNFLSHEEADQRAERMAKMGVNLVRLHFLDNDWGESLFDPQADNTQVFRSASLDKMDYLIAALKKRGIYVYPDWSVGRKFRAGDQVPGSGELEMGAKTVIHFSRRIIELNKKYAELLLTHVNPYTGLALKDDPVYVGNEIVNESSIFSGFWEQKFPQPFWDDLQAQYKAWGGHGGITRFRFDWDDVSLKPTLNPENEAQSLRFLLRMVVKSNREMKDFLKPLSPHALLSGSNMGMPVLGNTYGDSVMDFQDSHGYWDYPQYEVTSAGWSDAEHAPMYNDSQLRKPFKPYEGPPLLRLSHDAVEGKPFLCTEWNYCFPNEYRLEGPVLMAAYGSLQGWDGMLEHSWAPLRIGQERMTNLDINSRPDNESLFMAGALIYRLGYLKSAPVTVVEPLSDEAVLKSGMKSEWFSGHPWVPYVAKLAKRFTGKKEEPAADLSEIEKLNDETDKVLTSTTGEETLDYGKGVLKIDSPQAQGFVGAIGTGETLKTSGLSLNLAKRNPWAAVLAVSLDRKPLDKSERFMVFAQARAENSGQVFNGTRTALKDAGKLPILMQGVKGEVTLAVEPTRKFRVVPVDESGKEGRPLKASLTRGGLQFNLSPTDHTAYYQVTALLH